jgi:hypothetical protein
MNITEMIIFIYMFSFFIFVFFFFCCSQIYLEYYFLLFIKVFTLI